MYRESPPGPAETRDKAASQANVRHQNLALVTRLIFGARTPPSRADLAASTGLGRATVSRLVQELLTGGIVAERAPEGTATRGRPGTPLAAAERTLAGIGLETNVDFVAGRAIDLAGNTLAEFRLGGLGSFATPHQMLQLLGDSATAMASSLRDGGIRLVGATLSLPGLVNTSDNHLLVAPNLGWTSFNPIDELGDRWSAMSIPTTTRNDADTQSLTAAYARPGMAHDDTTFLYVVGDIGIGGALISNGRLTRGSHGWAGEIGHITVDPSGPECSCGSKGCLEAFAGQAVIRAASGLPPTATAADMVALLSQRDATAIAAVQRAGWALALAISDVINILDIPRIVFGTSLGAILPWLRPHIEEGLATHVIGFADRDIELVQGPDIASPACTGGAYEVLHTVICDPASWIDHHGDSAIEARE